MTPSRCSTRRRSATRRRKAWGATKRATDALVLVQEGEEPQPAGQARRALLRLSALDPAYDVFQGQYNTRSALLHVNCFYDVSMAGTKRTTGAAEWWTTFKVKRGWVGSVRGNVGENL